MENKTESNKGIEQEPGNYLGLNFIRAPKRNHDAMTQIGQPFVEWFKKHGGEVRDLLSKWYSNK